MRVLLFIPCLTDAFAPRAGIAVVRVLEHFGCRVEFPPGQTCCGQPLFNNGLTAEARELARRMVEQFAGDAWVVTPSGSCAAMIHEHFARLLADEADLAGPAADLARRTREFCEFLVNELRVDLRGCRLPQPLRVTYHAPCHLRAIGVRDEPQRLLHRIGGVELAPLQRAGDCCGFGGLFATKMPEISVAMGRDKLADAQATGAAAVVSNEAGCTLHLDGLCRRAGTPMRFVSAAELIAEGLGLLPPMGATA